MTAITVEAFFPRKSYITNYTAVSEIKNIIGIPVSSLGPATRHEGGSPAVT